MTLRFAENVRGSFDSRKWFWVVLIAAALLRAAALSSDAYTRLDWSAALLTDEGFYIHNARNVVLFGQARTDEFNNMLLAPLLHSVQVGVFTVFGVGAVQARSISVVCSLLTLVLLWSALRRCLGDRVALTAVLFLALDHTNLLYNRLALLDTPAAFLAVSSFYAFVRGTERPVAKEEAGSRDTRWFWLILCGGLLGLTVTNRTLAAYMIPAPFVGLWIERGNWKSSLTISVGLAAVLASYAFFWYWPNRAEMSAMNHYYRTTQIQPHSFAHLMDNVRQAFVGDFRGVSPYLLRHSPVVYLLALGGVIANCRRLLTGPKCTDHSSIPYPALAYLVGWFAFGWMALATISYSPSRYYVTLYPAMAALAAYTLWRIVEWAEVTSGARLTTKLVVGLIAGFTLYHGGLAILHYRGPLGPLSTTLLLSTMWLATALVVVLSWNHLSGLSLSRKAMIVPAAVVLWAGVNAAWMMDWAAHIEYTQNRMSRWLGQNLPRESVLIGDVAPGITMDNQFKAIHVQPGLANDTLPVERFEGQPRFIAILSGRWKEKYWMEHYPELLSSDRLVSTDRVLRWDLGVFSVDEPRINP